MLLNRDRQLLRAAWPVLMGAGGAVSGGKLGPEWWRALTDDDTSAKIAAWMAK